MKARRRQNGSPAATNRIYHCQSCERVEVRIECKREKTLHENQSRSWPWITFEIPKEAHRDKRKVSNLNAMCTIAWQAQIPIPEEKTNYMLTADKKNWSRVTKFQEPKYATTETSHRHREDSEHETRIYFCSANKWKRTSIAASRKIPQIFQVVRDYRHVAQREQCTPKFESLLYANK